MIVILDTIPNTKRAPNEMFHSQISFNIEVYHNSIMEPRDLDDTLLLLIVPVLRDNFI